MVGNTKVRFFIIGLATAFSVLSLNADYPGNANFRNVSSSFAAKDRASWATNVTTMVGSARNPGVSTPIDWDSCPQRIAIAPGVDYIPAILTTAGGWPRQLVCHFVRIDLKTPNIRFTGTDRCADWGDPMPEDYASGYEKRTVREKTTDFLARNRGAKSLGGKARNAVLAWNNAAWSPWISPYANLWGSPNGPLYSDGIQVSEIATGYGTHASASVPSGMVAVFKDGTADLIPQMTTDIAKRTWFCVPAFVARLVSSGQVPTHGDTSVDPRTAIGVSQDKRYIYLIACDGRRDGWSSGCDFPSLSTLLVAMGCWDAINLDGGGSSTLCAWNEAANKPSVLNRPSSSSSWNLSALRDNGSNAAIYFRAPDAMLSTYIYDDFDFLMQDIIDGETPSGATAIDVLGDATFTAEHPCIPSGTGAWSLSSTNNASIGWEDGVAPQVASGTTVTFRDIRFREGSGTLAVAAGGKAILNGVTGLNAVETQNAADLVIAGVLSTPLRVSCASATNRNDVFATSTLSLAAATTMAAQIVCGTDEDLIAVASGTDGNVSLSWDTILEFGRHHGSFGTSTDSASVSVTIAETAGALPAGSRLKLTVTSEDGSRSAVQYQALNGPGRYTFDTSVSSLPSICQSGYNYTYIVEVTDANGVRVPHAETVSGAFSIGRDKPWFAAAAADDSATGGAWISKPAITNGAFEIVEGGEPGVFEASASRTGRVRVSTVASFPNPLTPDHVEMALADFGEMEAPPLGSLLIAEKADGEPAWFGLVRANGALAFQELAGPVALGEPVEIVQEVDWSSGSPRVSYLVAIGEGEAIRLADANGNAWFDSASSANASAGRVRASGEGRVFSLQGDWIKRSLDNATMIMAY
jgi:hypothetical protein